MTLMNPAQDVESTFLYLKIYIFIGTGDMIVFLIQKHQATQLDRCQNNDKCP